MEIIIAKNSGLCYGVKRALRIVEETRKQEKGRIFTLGDLIHNPQIIANLRKQDIFAIADADSIREGAIIIRSHGVSPEIYEQIERKKKKIIDATCPIVKKIQKLVADLASREEEIIIVGNKNHPEIKGLLGYSKGKGVVIENINQANRLPKRKKRSVLAQSTQDLLFFKKLVASLIERTQELKVYNTICESTQSRQKHTSKLASQVDTLFILGGKNSSNTNKLYQISKNILSNTYFIESAEHISSAMLKEANKVGLSGGASTPPEALQDAVVKIKESFKLQFQRENIIQCQS
ncbi:4-hydroxy-3-methylbut-2-enyl diphosphate reductase [Acidobacteriota bacterium]